MMHRSVAVDIIHHHFAPAHNESEEMNQALAEDLTSGHSFRLLERIYHFLKTKLQGRIGIFLRPTLNASRQHGHEQKHQSQGNLEK